METPPRGDEREYGRGSKPRRASGAVQAERRGQAQRTRPGEQSLEVEPVEQTAASVVNGPLAAPRSSLGRRVNEAPVAVRTLGPGRHVSTGQRQEGIGRRETPRLRAREKL